MLGYDSRSLEILRSGEHIMRVKGYTKILAEKFKELYPEYNLTDETIDNIVEASALHEPWKNINT